MIDAHELTRLLGDLVAVNSINPDLVPSAPGEAEAAGHIARWLEADGLEVRLDEALAGRPNVIARARGTGGGRTLLLNGHIDTVGVGDRSELHKPRVEAGRLYGRGAYDMKAGVAACMLAVAAAQRHRLRGDVLFTAVVDEEYAGAGTQAVARRYRADGAVIAEPTELQLVVAHKGFVWLDVETHGLAAHGSRPDLGVDAIAHMGRVLAELEDLQQTLQARPAHPRLGHGSLHASLIQGGQELSSYPERCRLSIERRTLPGETPESVTAEWQSRLDRLGRADPAFRATLYPGLARPPLETPEDAAIVRAVQQAAAPLLGRPCALTGVPYWTDAATLWAAGIPAVLFGPAGAGAHAAEEWVDLESVRVCAEVYLATALAFCP